MSVRRRFDLDEEYLEDLKAEIIQAKKLAIDEDGAVLVWKGNRPVLRLPAETRADAASLYTPPPGRKSRYFPCRPHRRA